MKFILKLLGVVSFVFTPIRATADDARDVRFALSLPYLTHKPAEYFSNGYGLLVNYEIPLRQRFYWGVNAAFRIHPGHNTMDQIGYGLIMRHKNEINEQWLWSYSYGLLLQMVILKQRENFGTAHDTRLSLGLENRGSGFFTDLSYHISKLRYFEQPSIPLNRLQLDVGWIWRCE